MLICRMFTLKVTYILCFKWKLIKLLIRRTNSSSSMGSTAHCGLWPVEQCPSIFSYLPPTLSIFSLPALEDLFLLPLSIFSWVFPFFSSLPVLEWRFFFLGILSSSILSRWPNQLIRCPFIHFTVFSPLLISYSSRFVRLFHSPFSYLGPYIDQKNKDIKYSSFEFFEIHWFPSVPVHILCDVSQVVECHGNKEHLYPPVSCRNTASATTSLVSFLGSVGISHCPLMGRL